MGMLPLLKSSFFYLDYTEGENNGVL